MLTDPFNLILLAAAIVVFWRLYTVLGTRTGSERPPFDPFARRSGEAPGAPKPVPAPVSDAPAPVALGEAEPKQPVWQGYAREGSSLAQGLEKIAAADLSFTPKAFVAGAKLAYEMIIEAFARGDKAALKPLLTREVLEGFARVIDGRAAEQRKLETRFVGINKADITEATLDGSRATIAVRFVSEMISATRNAANEVVEGDPQEVRQITDLWTFERDTSLRDPNWKLAGTDDDA